MQLTFKSYFRDYYDCLYSNSTLDSYFLCHQFFQTFLFWSNCWCKLNQYVGKNILGFCSFCPKKILGFGYNVLVCGGQSTKNFLHQDGWCLVSSNLGISLPWGASVKENWRYIQRIVLGSTAYSYWSLQGWWWKQRRIS